MSHKEEILRTALLGTAEQPLPNLTGSGKLELLLKEISERQKERGKEFTLLDAAAVLYTYEKAGFKPAKFSGEYLEPAKDESKPTLAEAATAQLRLLLDSRQDLLPEYLRLLAESGKLVPNECLVQLLETGQKNKPLRGAIKKCVGERAAFLAAINPDWHFIISDAEISKASTEELRKLWDFGSKEERLQALKEARLKDPQFGLELLSSSWKDDNAEDRLKFLSVIASSPVETDEKFLEETVLDDRRKEVRRAAQEMLVLLSESRFTKRAEARLTEAIKVQAFESKTNLLSKLFTKQGMQLLIQAPEQCDKSMMRDGLSPKSPDSRMGERAWLLSQMLGQVRLSKLLDSLKLSPSQLLSLASGNEWQLAIYYGLEDAALRFKDAEMARLLLEIDFAISEIPRTVPLQDARKLLALLPAAEKEALVSQLLERNRFLMVRQVETYNDSQVLNLLMSMDEPWSAEFSKLVLRSVRTHMTQRNNYIFMDYIMRHIGNHLDTDAWALVQDSWANCGNYDAALGKMMTALSLRQEMKQSLREEN